MAVEWTDERVEMLKDMWGKGFSARDIAEKLGGVTRNAVIGKAHRLGLSSRPSSTKKKEALPKAKDVGAERTDKLCQWPIGDPGTPDFKFCYGDAVSGRPYCEEHCNIAYRRGND